MRGWDIGVFKRAVVGTRFAGVPAVPGPCGDAYRVKAAEYGNSAAGYMVLRMPTKLGAPPSYARPANGAPSWSLDDAVAKAAEWASTGSKPC